MEQRQVEEVEEGLKIAPVMELNVHSAPHLSAIIITDLSAKHSLRSVMDQLSVTQHAQFFIIFM